MSSKCNSTSYQEGSIERIHHGTGPDSWTYRWWEAPSHGDSRVHRRKLIGTVDDYPTLGAAKRAVESFRAEINAGAQKTVRMTALRMALSRRSVQPGLVHHSDRGSQYASNDYTDLLKANGIDISMSRKGNPWDNAACESFMETLKYEEILHNEYRDLAEARASIPEFLEKIYNQKRLHSALGYLPPVKFEAQLKVQIVEAASRQLVA
jgi:transposase InsO family protein